MIERYQSIIDRINALHVERREAEDKLRSESRSEIREIQNECGAQGHLFLRDRPGLYGASPSDQCVACGLWERLA
jgi:hypothetical protein